MMSVLVDTGPLVALFSAQDAHHKACVDQLVAIQRPMLTCWPVITEAIWLLREYSGAAQKLLRCFADGGLLRIVSLDGNDAPRIARIMENYTSLGTQLADAALVHLAERDDLRTIFTLDRRDFAVYRLSRNRRLHLIP